MAQPNLAAIGQAYNVLGAEMPLMVNHPAIGQVAELRQAIEQMGAQLAAQMGAQIDARIAQLEDRVVAKIDFVSHLAHARALNSAASNDDSRLHPIPLPDPNANVDILAQFPPTRRHFRVLSGPELNQWILRYGLVAENDIPHLIGERRAMLADHWGIYL